MTQIKADKKEELVGWVVVSPFTSYVLPSFKDFPNESPSGQTRYY